MKFATVFASVVILGVSKAEHLPTQRTEAQALKFRSPLRTPRRTWESALKYSPFRLPAPAAAPLPLSTCLLTVTKLARMTMNPFAQRMANSNSCKLGVAACQYPTEGLAKNADGPCKQLETKSSSSRL
ncbi:hypothetical protein L915_12723 [Phytophthora nicotianae]|uniref:RxLR effector protein n=2 Tax=Phytophthora nicotianae TaxID=4792 RepID=W2R663_PHYN3|nr:hypothetical protein PPTG_21202 [Phytophthora nicotianae INRA-310]ETK81798.1 hypothetical protein L915_12723 [Phytophthora nicotianae]ETN20005.1 hypothetical protein PPTG_21202 [Phytophthora nicotianae INRA-310]